MAPGLWHLAASNDQDRGAGPPFRRCVPGLSDVGMIFGLGSIAWFAWAGIVLLRDPETATAAVDVTH